MQLRPEDHRILRELTADGRISNVELARRVHMSESACIRRVRSLEDSGVIAGYRAMIDPKAIGRNLAAYLLVKLEKRTDTNARAFLDAINSDDRIIVCASVTGNFDILMEVAVRDVADLTNLTIDTLLKMPFVGNVVTCLALRMYKTSGPSPSSPPIARRF